MSACELAAVLRGRTCCVGGMLLHGCVDGRDGLLLVRPAVLSASVEGVVPWLAGVSMLEEQGCMVPSRDRLCGLPCVMPSPPSAMLGCA